MKIINLFRKKNVAKYFYISLCVYGWLFVSPFNRHAYAQTNQCASYAKEIRAVRLSGLSSDQVLMFDVCFNDRCGIVLKSVTDGSEHLYLPKDKSLSVISGSLATNGLAAVVMSENPQGLAIQSQVGLLDFKKRQVEIVTNSIGYKYFPTLDPARGEILYAVPGRERSSGKTQFSDWDIYSFNLRSKKQVQLTHNEFFLISSAMYLDSQHIIFSGDAPYIVDGDRSMAESFAKRGGENTVYRYKIGATSPELLFKELKSSVGPMASDDRKKIVYVSRSEKLSKDKKYQFDVILFSDGKHVPLTDPGPPITALVISADGKHAAITRMNSDSSPLVTVIDIEDKNKTSKVRLKPVFDNCDFFTEELKHGS